MARAATPSLLAAFVANGVGLPSFIARLPERQRDLELSDAALGVTVLGAALGALLASPAAGAAVHRLGSRRTFLVAGAASAATLWFAGAAGSAGWLFAALLVVGACDASMDVAMNASGVAHEAASGRSVLHRLHGAWSLGALGGAGLAWAAASAGVSMTIHLAAVGVLIAAGTAVAAGGLVQDGPAAAPEVDPATARGARSGARRRLLVLVGAATVAASLVEGTGLDWAAIQADRAGLPVSSSALGTAAFMGGMLLGRLLGDRRTDDHGPATVLRRGMALVAGGLLLAAAWAHPAPFLVGVALAGYGLAVFFPLAFSSAIRVAGGFGSAVVSSAARLGFILEPAVVGAVAGATDLRVAFAGAAAIAVGLAAAAPRLTFGDG